MNKHGKSQGGILVHLLFLSGLVLVGAPLVAQTPPGGEKKADPPEVVVRPAVVRDITDYEHFVGRLEAVNRVEVRARVTGFIDKVAFKEGGDVKQGDLLFEIDARPYQARLNQAQAQLTSAEAALKLAVTVLQRDRDTAKATPGSISPQQLDQDQAAAEEARARIDAARATLDLCKLDLSFTRVTAPINGRVGATHETVGNLVVQDKTLLTTIVSLDPIYAYFDVDERSLLKIRKAINDGKMNRPPDGELPVFMGLGSDTGYPHKGKLDFVSNQLDPNTGTIRMRGVFANPEPPGGIRALLPGMFARIRIPIGQPRKALLVPETAIHKEMTPDGKEVKGVFVVDRRDKVVFRRVTVGSAQDDWRIVEEGLKEGDRVVLKPGSVKDGLMVKPVPAEEKP
jgi:membrane fusion protein, multidrug efflux system